MCLPHDRCILQTTPFQYVAPMEPDPLSLGTPVAPCKIVKQLIGGMPEGVKLYRYSPLGAGRSSYLLIDSLSQTAAAVDPQGDLDPYLEDAWALGAKIKHCFLSSLRDD